METTFIQISASVLASIIAVIGGVISAKISNRQKENELKIARQEEIIKNLKERLDAQYKAEQIYLDMIKEWSGDPKKLIKEQVSNSIHR